MTLDPVRRPTLADEVLATFRKQITEGVWPVGSRIPSEPELMRQLGVARGTVREAIRALAHSGMLEVLRGDGTYVRAGSELSGVVQRLYIDRTTDDLLQVRSALEAKAARLAAEHIAETELDELQSLLQLRAVAWKDRDFESWVSADWQFHSRVVDASGNDLLSDLYRDLSDPLRSSMSELWERSGFNGADPAGHEHLLAALRNRDAEEAAKQADANIDATTAWHQTSQQQASE